MTKLSHCCVKYRLEGEGSNAQHVANFNLSADKAAAGPHLKVDVRQDGGQLQASIIAACSLEVLDIRFEFQRDFAPVSRVLFNGYQSWTDTAEVLPMQTMRGLVGTPAAAVDRFVLYGGGDYRFVDYENRPGYLHGWTYCYFKESDSYELIASLHEQSGFTLLGMDCAESLFFVQPEPPAGMLAPDEAAPVCSLGFYAGSELDPLFDKWFDDMGTHALPAPVLCGYSSWYRHYEKINEEKILRDLYGACRAFDQLDTEGLARVFQIDDGFAKVGDWLELSEEKFPSGMERLVSAISGAGFLPGLWLAPFVCEADSELFFEHPDWLLINTEGGLTPTGSHWSGGFALDTLNPEVREYVRDVIRTVTCEWGFKLLKLDFLYAACIIPHGGMNRGQLMADAVDLLREAAGPDVLLLGCGVPLASAFGKMEYCRIGCDVGLDWDGKLYERGLHRERISTRRSLSNTVYRAQLNGRAFKNDPDVLLLRDDVRLTNEQRNMLIDADACFGGMLLTSDAMGDWEYSQLTQYQEALKMLRLANNL